MGCGYLALSLLGLRSKAWYFVSVDFGTHGSGFAYSAKADGDSSPRTYENWPSQHGSPAPKTRTALLYKTSNLSTPLAWGWSAVSQYVDLPEEERSNFILLESFKKYLMPQDFAGLASLPSGLSPEKLVADFLYCLVNEVINPTMKDHYGIRYNTSAVRWCMTVPAGLSQSSMSTMRVAAMKAGMIPSQDSPALLLASEPEAAALTAQQRKDLMGITHGGRLMILDLGGGTVDMTIHRVDSVLNGSDMSLSELTHRECLAEGATRVDERFQTHLAHVLGADTCSDWVRDPTNAEEVQLLLYDEWEACKCAFVGGGSNSSPIHVNLPESLVFAASPEAQARLEAAGYGDRLVLNESTTASFFQPSLDTIIDKAREMLTRAGGADVIVLVGGFSCSRFVMRTIRAALETTRMPVVCPAYGRTAVLEGGVWLSRYPGAIAARRSCMSYGIRAAIPWREGAPSKVWLSHKSAYRCLDGFVRYVHRDELVKAGSVISKTFYPIYPAQAGVVFDIFGCLQKDARYTTAQSMQKIATVRVDFPPVSDPDSYCLTAHFSFGEAQISVRCVDEQTGKEQRTTLLFDSSEVLRDQLKRQFEAFGFEE